MKKVQTFTTKHLYYLLATGLLLTVVATAPFLMEADVTKTDNDCATKFDKDCDGVLNFDGSCQGNTCTAYDQDDTDPGVGTFNPQPGDTLVPTF